MEDSGNVPFTVSLLRKCFNLGRHRRLVYQASTLVLTFAAYASFHMSRRPLAVVKNSLNQDCSKLTPPSTLLINATNKNNWCDWAPFDQSNANQLLGVLDSCYIFAYAASMFISGFIAERVDLRYYLSLGMLFSGIFTYLFGIAYYLDIHSFPFFVFVQLLGGIVQSTGWPGVVVCVGNWFGKSRRGLIFGIWNAHLYVGNILGAYVAGYFVVHNWGLSFIVPAVIIGVVGFLQFLFLVPHPGDVGCDPTDVLGVTPPHIHAETAVQNSTDSPVVNSFNQGASEKCPLENMNHPVLTEKSPLNFRPSSPSSTSSGSSSQSSKSNKQAITFWNALRIPGVLEFSLCLFFSKLVSYTFLFWLPRYLAHTTGKSSQDSAYLSIAFDVGGIIGGILAGAISDKIKSSAVTCLGFLALSIPFLMAYNIFGSSSDVANIMFQLVCGALVNGPYALITTAVSAELGTHHTLQSNSKALATVTAIIDGTGSIGAAVGPLLAGVVSEMSWTYVFYMMMVANFFALLSLSRIGLNEFRRIFSTERWCSCLPRTRRDTFEHKLVKSGRVPGTVHAAPSAPSYVEGDSDCDSWGSDFDDDDNTNVDNSKWEEPQDQEVAENDINSLLEAAMERTRNLENSRFASNDTSQQLPTGCGVHLQEAVVNLTTVTSPDAPPLPPRNPGQPFNNPDSGTSSEKSLPLSSTNEAAMNPAWRKHRAQVTHSPSSGMVAPPVQPSTSTSTHRATSSANTETQVPENYPRDNKTFPPDVANVNLSSGITETKPSSFPQGEAKNESANAQRDLINSSNESQQMPEVVSPQDGLPPPKPNVPTAEPSGLKESKEKSVPPPLPTRPPPLPTRPPPPKSRIPLNSPKVNNRIGNFGVSSSAIPKDNTKPKNNPPLPTFNTSVKAEMNRNASSSQTNLAENSLQNSSISESAEVVSSRISGVSPVNSGSAEPPRIQFSKGKKVPFPVPKFIRDLDDAMLKQVMPKTSARSYTISEMQQSAPNSTSPSTSGSIEKAEDLAQSPTDEYLNPKEIPSSGTGPTEFVPDRPTLPRRLKQSRSLPLLLKSNVKVAANEKNHKKSSLELKQAANETSEKGSQYPAATDEIFRQPWYHPVTWSQAQFKLTIMGLDGAFLVRPSSRVSQGVPYTVSVFFRGRIINCQINYTPEGKCVLGKLKPNQKSFSTITELIRYYQSTPAELKVTEVEPVSKVCLLVTPPKDNDKIYADA